MRANEADKQRLNCIPVWLLPAMIVAGCTVGPEYTKPEVAVPAVFRAQITPAEAASFADLPWWSVFHDTVLQGLVTEALASNYDLQIAVARIEQARAKVEEVDSQSKPQVGYGATATGEKVVVPGKKSLDSVTYGSFAGLLSASWELDIWGRIRHQTESAQANLLGQQYVRHGIILTLVSDVAADYFQLLELDRELAIANGSAEAYRKTLDLFTLRYGAGKDSRLPVERARAAYQSSLADIHDLNRRIGQQEDAISILLGAYPKAISRGHGLTDQSVAATPVGSTTALLRRRPDILEAEQGMIAANADIGAAVADFYPKIGLSTFLGGQGVGVGGLWGGFGIWNLAAALAGPIYSGGRLEAVYKERQAFWDETVAQYRQTIVGAFRDTSDALIAQQNLGPQRVALEGQVGALHHSVDLALLRYQAGRASYFEVLEAQQLLFPAEDLLAQVQREQLIAVVNLYKALGGGWDQREPTLAERTASTNIPPAPAQQQVAAPNAAPGQPAAMGAPQSHAAVAAGGK
ncbi:MAG TPA: efflux transporter outer membrane subunit [Rhizomicrobium sp.]